MQNLRLVLIVNKSEVEVPVTSLEEALKNLQALTPTVKRAYLDSDRCEGVMSFVRLKKSKRWVIDYTHFVA